MHEEKFFLWWRILSLSVTVHLVSAITLFWCYRYDIGCLAVRMNSSSAISSVMFVAPRSSMLAVKKQGVVASNITPKKEAQHKKEVIKKEKAVVVKQESSVEKKEAKKVSEVKPLPVSEKPVIKKEPEVKEQVNQKVEPKKELVSKLNDCEITQKNQSIVKQSVENEMGHFFTWMQQEILKNWSAPLGVAKDSTCTISFSVDLAGRLQQIVIDKASGILMYDISARSAVLNTKMPPWSRGKSFTITFHA